MIKSLIGMEYWINQKMLLECVTEIRDMQKLIETELHSSITMIENLVRHMSQMDSEIKQLKSQLASKDKQISELSFEDAKESSPKRTVMYTPVKYLQQPMDDFKTPPKSKVSKECLNEPSISDQHQHQTKTDTGLQAPATSAAKKLMLSTRLMSRSTRTVEQQKIMTWSVRNKDQ